MPTPTPPVILLPDAQGDYLRVEEVSLATAAADDNPTAVVFACASGEGVYLTPTDVDLLRDALRPYGTGPRDGDGAAREVTGDARVAALEQAMTVCDPSTSIDRVLAVARFLVGDPS